MRQKSETTKVPSEQVVKDGVDAEKLAKLFGSTLGGWSKESGTNPLALFCEPLGLKRNPRSASLRFWR